MPPLAPGQPARQMAFDRLDSNGDGYLSLDELMVQLPANDGSSDAGGLLTCGVDEAFELAGALGLPTSCLACWRLQPACAPLTKLQPTLLPQSAC